MINLYPREYSEDEEFNNTVYEIFLTDSAHFYHPSVSYTFSNPYYNIFMRASFGMFYRTSFVEPSYWTSVADALVEPRQTFSHFGKKV